MGSIRSTPISSSPRRSSRRSPTCATPTTRAWRSWPSDTCRPAQIRWMGRTRGSARSRPTTPAAKGHKSMIPESCPGSSLTTLRDHETVGTGRASSDERYRYVALLLEQPLPRVETHTEPAAERVHRPPAVPEPHKSVIGVDLVGDYLMAAPRRGVGSDLDQAGGRVRPVEA